MDLARIESARALAAAIASGRIRSRDTVDAVLESIAESPINAVVTVDAPAARSAADSCDRAVRAGERLGPLHGVPMTLKDAWAVSGMRSTSGLQEYADDVPAQDAIAVARLRAAGAVIVGKTNVPPGITGQETANALFGRTLNPWDHERTPGGSSGGAAAAVASGLTWVELGSDSGGSIRQPAHCCGIYGHVPTHGLVPLRGHRPQVPFEHVCKDVDLMTAGPLARHPDDLALMIDLLSGDDPAVGDGMRFDLPPSALSSLSGARVAVWLDDPFCPVSREVAQCLSQVAAQVSDAGAEVGEFAPSFSLEQAWEVAFALWVASSSARTDEKQMRRLREQRDEPGLVGARARAETMEHREWLRLDEQRHELQRRWVQSLQDVDVLLSPVITVPAPAHDPSPDPDVVASVDHRIERTIDVDGVARPYLDQLTWNIVTGLAGLPSTVAPAGGTSTGLPVGVQIVGDRYRDRTTIGFAALLRGAGIGVG